MKTTKKLIILCLALVMAVVAVIPSTFSWYSHNGTYKGKSFKLNYSTTGGENSSDNRIPVSNGEVTLSTVSSDLNWIAGSTASSFSVPAKSTNYYITTIENHGSTDVNVNLYANQLLNDDNVYVGVVNPVVNERNFAGEPIYEKTEITNTSSNDKIRVYFQDRAASGWANNDIYIRYTTDGSSWSPISASSIPSDIYKLLPAPINEGSGNKTWFYDLPANTKTFYFISKKYFTDYSSDSKERRWHQTEDISELNTRTVYYLTYGATSNNKADFGTFRLNNLASVLKYYKSVELSPNSKFDIALTNSEYTGSSLTYSFSESSEQTSAKFGSGSTNNISVDPQTGRVTLDNAPRSDSNTVIIYTKVTGELGDVYSVPTTIKVPTNITGVPIVQNLLMKANSDPVEVRWYIRNTSNEPTDCGGLFYTI